MRAQKNIPAFAFVVCAVLGMVSPLSATTVQVSQTNISLFTPSNTVSVNTVAKLGYFVQGFTPSLANITSWDENFQGYNGYWQASTKRFLVSMTLGDGGVGAGTQTGVTGFGVTNKIGNQLYLIGSSAAYNSAANTNNTINADYLGTSAIVNGFGNGSTGVFVLTDASWIIPTTTALDTTTTAFGFTGNTALAVFGGTTWGSSFSFNPTTQVGSLTMIPEPTSTSLVLLGAVTALSLRKRRDSSRKAPSGSKQLRVPMAGLLLGITLMCLPLHAQVSTPIVGFQKTTLGQGYNSLGFPLVNSPILTTTTAANVSGSSISLSSPIPSTVSASSAYYLEVTSGTKEGERVDVTITPGSSTVSIVSGSANNTSNLSGLTSGSQVVVRKHLTLGDLGSSVSPSLAQNDNPDLADKVYVFSGSAFVYYYKGGDGLWYENGGLDDMSGLQINPGSGVLLYKVSNTSSSITMTGSVRSNKFARNYTPGYQSYAPAYPVSYSPAAMGANDWSGNVDPRNSDAIYPFSGSFVQYYLDPTDTTGSAKGTWLEVGGLDARNSDSLVNSDKLALVFRKNQDLVVETPPVQ